MKYIYIYYRESELKEDSYCTWLFFSVSCLLSASFSQCCIFLPFLTSYIYLETRR